MSWLSDDITWAASVSLVLNFNTDEIDAADVTSPNVTSIAARICLCVVSCADIMKLDYETIQFERQLKRATRLSLLDFAATERRRQLSTAIKTRQTKRSIKTYKNTKNVCSRLPFSARKLHSTANNIVARRKIVQNARARKSRIRRLSLKHSQPYSDSRTDGPSSPRLSRLNLDARLEIVWSDRVDSADSGFDDNPSAESSVDDTEKFNAKKLPQPSFRLVKGYIAPAVMSPRPDSYYRLIEQTPEDLDNEVEYDVDEEV